MRVGGVASHSKVQFNDTGGIYIIPVCVNWTIINKYCCLTIEKPIN